MSDLTERAKAVLEGVTRGPWRVGKRKRAGIVLTPHGCVWHPSRGEINNPRDAEFIAAARELVPELVAEVERLREEKLGLEISESDLLVQLRAENERLRAALFLIQEARIDYDGALHRRAHGAVAADRFMRTIFDVLDALEADR
ncbi:hypothetical protein QEH38_gp71 [Mycobacterium phage LilSpotty]|uniref:Uncharacterized protein n=1 Tax=Mycobacterium phage LilSpotty TaxID=2588512 RepID=A0A4Y6EM83_9CAUD|nr:hypothetical protein QEH38_gp71 [Mycobacterium phage LilSpotty]QDF19803.1 hypothetical protein SEA_LILSPOTTY_71 [Mycobacterium phage LilSpotty]